MPYPSSFTEPYCPNYFEVWIESMGDFYADPLRFLKYFSWLEACNWFASAGIVVGMVAFLFVIVIPTVRTKQISLGNLMLTMLYVATWCWFLTTNNDRTYMEIMRLDLTNGGVNLIFAFIAWFVWRHNKRLNLRTPAITTEITQPLQETSHVELRNEHAGNGTADQNSVH